MQTNYSTYGMTLHPLRYTFLLGLLPNVYKYIYIYITIIIIMVGHPLF